MESSKGEQASVVFLGRDTFRMRVVSEAVEEDGAIPTALSEGQTGRIFDRRRVPRTTREAKGYEAKGYEAEAREAEVVVPARVRRIPLFMLFTTVAAALFVAAAVFVVRTHPTAGLAVPAPVPAPVTVAPPAPPVPAPLDEPTPAAIASPVGSSAPVVPAPLDEPTPAAIASAPTIEGPSPEATPKKVEAPIVERPEPRPATRRPGHPTRAARPAPAKRILPPTRPWVDPFAG